MKTKKIPFDIEKAKNGAKIVTRDGHKVDTIRFDERGSYPISGWIRALQLIGDSDEYASFTEEGYYISSNNEDCRDLFIEVEESELRKMKKKLSPFSIEKAEAGAKIVTKNGLNVTIRAYLDDESYKYPIEAIIKDPTGKTTSKDTLYYSKEGRLLSSSECDLDLLIEEEEETDNYDPYKEVVKSISDMVERYTELQSLEDLQDFYDNVKVKCREAIEYDKKWCKKQDEQKTSDSLKIMPDKWYTCIESWSTIDMKIGDWFEEGYYYLGSDILKYKGLLEEDEDYKDFFRPWNINDAKPGDILFHSDSASNGIFIFKEITQDGEVVCYCDYDSEDGFCLGEKHTCCWTHSKILYPASIEQRKQLFIMMKEAGYKWDSDKKELRKIEKVKTRRMTRQELSDWLRDCPEEHREWKYTSGDIAYSQDCYPNDEAFKPVEAKLIRRNHGDWEEPLVEI